MDLLFFLIQNAMFCTSRDGSSLDSTRLARLDTIAKQGPGSTRPARKPEMLILDWLEASLF